MSSLLKKYGNIYVTGPDGNQISMPNLTQFVTIKSKYKTDPRFYLKHTISDGERLDTLSYKLYGTVDLIWLIIHANEMVNLSESWPLTSEQLDDFIALRYPFSKPIDVHHYESIDGHWTDPLAIKIKYGLSSVEEAISKYRLTPVSIWDYEYNINEAKREIILPDPDRLSEISKQLEELLNESTS